MGRLGGSRGPQGLRLSSAESTVGLTTWEQILAPWDCSHSRICVPFTVLGVVTMLRDAVEEGVPSAVRHQCLPLTEFI